MRQIIKKFFFDLNLTISQHNLTTQGDICSQCRKLQILVSDINYDLTNFIELKIVKIKEAGNE